LDKKKKMRNVREIGPPIGPRRLSFRIGKRGLFGSRPGTTLLMSDCLGVWSLRRCRYVKMTRFYHFYLLRAQAGAVEKRHASLLRLGMRSWPEYDEKVGLLRGKLADAYWAAAPAPYRESVVRYLRAARRERFLRHLAFYVVMAIFVALCLFVTNVAWSAVLPARFMFWYIVIGACLLFITGVGLWRETFDEPDVIAQMLQVKGSSSL
jgi:hypothetical protein